MGNIRGRAGEAGCLVSIVRLGSGFGPWNQGRGIGPEGLEGSALGDRGVARPRSSAVVAWFRGLARRLADSAGGRASAGLSVSTLAFIAFARLAPVGARPLLRAGARPQFSWHRCPSALSTALRCRASPSPRRFTPRVVALGVGLWFPVWCMWLLPFVFPLTAPGSSCALERAVRRRHRACHPASIDLRRVLVTWGLDHDGGDGEACLVEGSWPAAWRSSKTI